MTHRKTSRRDGIAPVSSQHGGLSLPLLNTYSLYKTGTDKVASFLLEAADQIRYSVQLDSGMSASGRRGTTSPITFCNSSIDTTDEGGAPPKPQSGSKTKRTKPHPKASLRTDQYIDIAKHIVSVNGKPHIASGEKKENETVSPQEEYCVLISDRFITTLESTIKAREKVSDFYTANGCHFDDTNTRNHIHFVKVLRRVLEMLRPYSDCGQSSAKALDINHERNECNFETRVAKSRACHWDRHVSDNSIESTQLENKFTVLSLQDPTEEEEEIRKVDTAKITSDLDNAATDDHSEILQIHCFLLDIQSLRDFIIETWKKYKDNTDNVDLLTAAFSTNTAIELAVNMYENLIEQFHTLQNYDELLSKYYAFCSSASPSASEASDSAKEQHLQYRERPEDQINFKLAGRHDLTMYATVFFLKEAMQSPHPLHRKKLQNAYDGTISRNDMDVRQKYYQNRHILHDLLADLRAFAHYPSKKKENNIDSRVTDQVTTHIAKLFAKNASYKCPTFAAVFSAQALLDMTYASGNNPCEAFHHLEDDAVYVRSSGRYTCGCDNPGCNDGTLKLLHDHFLMDYTSDLGNFLGTWVFNDEVERIKKSRYGKEEYSKHYKREESHWLLKHNPLLCGVIMFSARMRSRDIGLMVSNAFLCVNTMCHLYNAWLQIAKAFVADADAATLQGLDPDTFIAENFLWKDMEFFISAFSSKAVFSGNRPTSLIGCVDRFRDAVAQRKSEKNCKEGLAFWSQYFSPTIQFFSQRFGKHLSGIYWHIRTVDTLVRDIEDNINDNQSADTSRESSPVPASGKSGARSNKKQKKKAPRNPSINPETLAHDFQEVGTSKRTATEVLEKLRDSLIVESRNLRFDFLLLHRNCMDLILSTCGMIFNEPSQELSWTKEQLKWPMEGLFSTIIQNLNPEQIQLGLISLTQPESTNGIVSNAQNSWSDASKNRYKRCKLTTIVIRVLREFIQTFGRIELDRVEEVASGATVDIPIYSQIIAADTDFRLRGKLFNIDHEPCDHEGNYIYDIKTE